MGQPNVSANIKQQAGIKGEIDHTGALGFLRGLLAVLQQCGRPGLLLVLDEVETIQRVRSDSRDRSLEAIRKLIDDLYGGRFAGLYILITGTPAFFDGPNGVKRLPPLAQRLHVDFSGDAKWDNPRDVQVRLFPFDQERLIEVGRRVRDLYPTEHPERMKERVTDAVLTGVANEVAGKLGGKVGVAPRIFLRKLVATILDRADLFPDFDPAKDLDIRVDAGGAHARRAGRRCRRQEARRHRDRLVTTRPDAIDRLSPAVRYQIANGLGWSGLRPVQALSTEAILDGANCVVLAPTAGGKTEAAFLPLFRRWTSRTGAAYPCSTSRPSARCSTIRRRGSRSSRASSAGAPASGTAM